MNILECLKDKIKEKKFTCKIDITELTSDFYCIKELRFYNENGDAIKIKGIKLEKVKDFLYKNMWHITQGEPYFTLICTQKNIIQQKIKVSYRQATNIIISVDI